MAKIMKRDEKPRGGAQKPPAKSGNAPSAQSSGKSEMRPAKSGDNVKPHPGEKSRGS